jgi:hypothetical protein
MDKPLSDNLARVYGNYRAKVVDNKDTEFFGRILIWIPDLMVDIPMEKGLWARPANNPIGGRNAIDEDENWFMGSCYIPRIGSWVWIFFEAGNINKPYYFAGLDIEAAVVLPENRLGDNPEDKWTIFKSNRGRVVVISDDPKDERVEITGKKLGMTNKDTMKPPSGDTASVYPIDGNQTSILLDEREGKQKVLIRTVKGDFFHIDIDDQKLQAYFKSDILIKTDGNLLMTAQGNIELKSVAGDVRISADAGYMDVSANADYREYAGGNKSSKSMNSHYIQAQGEIHELAGGDIKTDAGGTRSDQCSTAEPAERAIPAALANPQGGRDT